MMILGFPRAARREYARALRESDPDEPVLVKNYALINQLLGRRDEAALWFRRLLELEPANPIALRALGPAPGPR
jgi:tetratricopeptide (TPR) repeat protein